MQSSTSSEIIAQLRTYNEVLEKHKNLLSPDTDKTISLFGRLDTIASSNEEAQNKQKQLVELQTEFDANYKQYQMHKDDYDKKKQDVQQQEAAYISNCFSNNTDTGTLIDVLRSGVLEYKYAVELIQHSDDIKQKIKDGKYVIARRGNRVALIAIDKDILGYKWELTNFLQQQDGKNISNVILSNVPVYNNGSRVLPFDKDVQDLPDNVLKIYFSVVDNDNISWVKDSKQAKLHCDVVEDVLKRLMEYQQKYGSGKKLSVQMECSSDGIDTLLNGVLSAKQGDSRHCLSLGHGSICMSLIPREGWNGVKPETTAKTVYELFQTAVRDGYNATQQDMAFVNLDISSNDGRFEYHNIGSTNSFLKELGRLQEEYNCGRMNVDKQAFLVAINDEIITGVANNENLQNKKAPWFTGIKHKDILKNVQENKNAYNGIQVRVMSDMANEIESKNTMHNKTAGVNKENKDGVSHNANVDKNTNNSTISATVVNDKVNKSI